MIYLDYNASTPIDPRVADAMRPYLYDLHGNPSSAHRIGSQVRDAVNRAREQVASFINAAPTEVVFTSGGTESSNHVIKGVAHTLRDKGRHIVTSAIEHPATLAPCHYLESLGFEVTVVGVDQYGWINPDEVATALRDDTILVSIMHANNEVGTIQSIEKISELTRARGIWLHTDAAQSCGKIPVDCRKLGVDFLSVAGHKFYAPQGIGALFIRDGIQIEPLMHGAGHESGRRAGTEAVTNIVGLGAAAELATEHLYDTQPKQCRDMLWEAIQNQLGDDARLLGHPENRLPNTLAVAFQQRIGVDLLNACPDICASTGAACHAKDRKRSAVLAAMDVPEEFAFGTVRFSTGRSTTPDDIKTAAPMIINAYRNLAKTATA